MSKAFLTLRLNETHFLPVDDNAVNTQPIFTGELDDFYVAFSASYQVCANNKYCNLDFGLTKKIGLYLGCHKF